MQGLFFADGGLSALGTNVTLIGVTTVLVGLRRRRARCWRCCRSAPAACVPAVAVGGLVSVPVAALVFVGLYAVGGAVPIPLGTLAATMLGWHTLIGIGEGVITAAVVGAVLATRPDLVHLARHLRPDLVLVDADGRAVPAPQAPDLGTGPGPTSRRPRARRPGRGVAGDRRCGEPVRLVAPGRAGVRGRPPRLPRQRAGLRDGGLAAGRLRPQRGRRRLGHRGGGRRRGRAHRRWWRSPCCRCWPVVGGARPSSATPSAPRPRRADGLYLPGDTVVHRLPAHVKVVAAVLLVVVVVATPVRAWPALVAFPLVVAGPGRGRPPPVAHAGPADGRRGAVRGLRAAAAGRRRRGAGRRARRPSRGRRPGRRRHAPAQGDHRRARRDRARLDHPLARPARGARAPAPAAAAGGDRGLHAPLHRRRDVRPGPDAAGADGARLHRRPARPPADRGRRRGDAVRPQLRARRAGAPGDAGARLHRPDARPGRRTRLRQGVDARRRRALSPRPR